MSDDKSCPFCGHTDIEHFYNRTGIDHSTCQYCGASAKDWNVRYDLSTADLVSELASREGAECIQTYDLDEFNWTVWDRTDDIQVNGGRVRRPAKILVVVNNEQ